MAVPSSKTKRLREMRLDPSKIAGHVSSSGGHDSKPGQAASPKALPASSRTSSVSSNNGSGIPHKVALEEVALELRRDFGEGLGMVLGVVEEEETEAKAGSTSSSSFRSVVVKSVIPDGAASRAEAADVSRCGFRVGDRIVQIDDHVLSELDDDGCLAVLQDIPEHCMVVVQRLASFRSPALSPTSCSQDLSTFSMTSSPPPPDSSSGSITSSSSSSSTSILSSPALLTAESSPARVVSPQRPPRTSPRALPSSPTSPLGSADGDGGRPKSAIPKPIPSARSPKPPPRKVRRQMSTAAHLAEKGLPGFVVRRVTVHKTGEGQSLGISVVPSFGATKFYYQVKRLLPGGACAQSSKVHVGDRLLECNGRSLQNLTQAQCLDILKAAGDSVTLTLLHEIEEDTGNSGGGDGDGVAVGGGAVPRASSLSKGATKKGNEEVSGEGSSRLAEDASRIDSRLAHREKKEERKGEAERSVDSEHDSELSKGRRDQPATERTDDSGVNGRVHSARPAFQDPRHSADQKDTRGSSHDVTTTKEQIESNNNNNDKVSDTKDHSSRSFRDDDADDDTMSNPFLDSPPPSEESVLAPTKGDAHLCENNGTVEGTVSSSNPFYQDLLGEPLVPKVAAESSDELVNVGMGDGLLTDEILLDVSGGDFTGQSASTTQANGAGGMDWLCGVDNDAQFGQADDGNIPPPMEFSDLGFGGGVVVADGFSGSTTAAAGEATGPVTNIDDLLGVDLTETTSASLTVSAEERKDRGSSGSSKSDDGFDFLLDADEAKEEAGLAPPMLAEIIEEEPPQLPSGPPPPVPSGPPPPVPTESFPDTEYVIGQDMIETTTTSVFLPSDNPSDNVTQIAVSSAATDASTNSNNAIHITDIKVSAPSSNVSSINVTKPKPPRTERAGGEVSLPGAAVVTVDNSCGVDNTTHIQFDNSTQETVVKAAVPLNAFRPTSMGITKSLKNRNQTTGGGDEEEEEITPMTVHRDHLGNKLATPSPPETLGKQSKYSPRKLDEEAKRDLQNILGEMSKKEKNPFRGVSVLQNGKQEEDAPTVAEDEIIPVKLTRKEAETAQEVLSKWMSSESNSSKTTLSSVSSGKKSGFQGLASTVIDVQSGKIQLPANSAFLTTIGITKTPKPRKQGGQEEEEEEEEEITPMTVHKDHLGNRHYAPSPPESLGKRSGVDVSRTLDPSAREDIAALLSGMTTSSKTRSKVKASSSSDADSGVVEDEIVATVLTKDEARVAMDTVNKWLSGGDEHAVQTPAKPSPFQRLVGDVIHSASVDTSAAETERVEDFEEESKAQFHRDVDEGEHPGPGHQIVEEASVQSSTSSSVSSEPPRQQPRAHSEVTQAVTSIEVTQTEETFKAPSPEPITQKPSQAPAVSPKPSPPPQVKPKGSLAERRTMLDQTVTEKKTETLRHNLRPVEIPDRKPPATTAPPTRAVELKPVPAQRVGGLRAPVKITSLSSLSSTRPGSKLGTLSVGSNRASGVGSVGGVPSLSAKLSSTTSVEYGKTRSDQEPFLVEVLKGIVGLGIKVKVNGQGHVEVTEVQKNSPVDKNGNVRVGDYLLAVNTTELTGLVEGRVQQVLRLLPRGVVKLVVSTHPPTSTQGSDSTAPTSPRTLGTYSQYGVRLAPQPYSPTSSDGSPPSLTSPAPVPPDQSVSSTTTTPAATTATSAATAPVTQPLAVSVGEEEQEDDEEDEDEMATRKLSKALSPRISTAQNFDPEPPAPPKPSPRQRGKVPASLSPRSRSGSSADEAQSPMLSPSSEKKPERKMTASEVVAAASRRPSGLDESLPEPDTLSPRRMSSQREEEEEEVKAQSAFTYDTPPPKPLSPTVDPFVAAARSPSGAVSPREEVLPVFAETAKKLSPVPTPRAKPRSSSSASDGRQEGTDLIQSPAHNDRDTAHAQADGVKTKVIDAKPKEVVVHAHAITVTNGAPPPSSPAASNTATAPAPKPVKIPPPVAPKPKRPSSVTSDRSSCSSPRPDETVAPQDTPSPTLVSSKLRDFADASTPTVKDQAQNRKKVTSAARMFEQKAAETTTKVVPALTQPTKSSRPVSSVVERFNRDPEPDPASSSSRPTGVVMRKISLGVSSTSGGEGGRSLNSALLPPSERRKSMPSSMAGSSTTSSLQLTKPSSRFRDPPLSSRSAGPDDPDPVNRSPRYNFNSSLRPRSQVSSNTTSLKSVIASRETRAPSPPSVGKDRVGRQSDAVTLRSRNAQHDSPEHDAVRSLRHTSWSPQSSGAADSHSPKMIFTSSSLHHTERHHPHDPSSHHIESTMKKFDDLLSDKHTLDSDDELPRVSNSVSLDLLKSRNAGRVAASMKTTSDKESAQEPTSAVPEDKNLEPKLTREREDVSSKAPEKPGSAKDSETAEVNKGGEKGIKTVTDISSETVQRSQAVTETASQSKAETDVKSSPANEVIQETVEQETASALSHSTQPVQEQVRPKTRRKVVDEDVGDAYPGEDTAAAPPMDFKMAADSYPEQDEPAVPLEDHMMPDAHPEQDTVPAPHADIEITAEAHAEEERATKVNTNEASPKEDTAEENAMYEQQASIIVQTVVSNALNNVNKTSREEKKKADEEEEAEYDAPPPPLPDEAPPPLPGAPPPPLIMRNEANNLVAPEDLEGMLPSQDSRSSKSPSPQVSPREDASLPTEDLQHEDIEEPTKTETVPPNFTLPEERDLPGGQEEESIHSPREQPVTDSDVLIAFDSVPSGPLPLSVDMDLLRRGEGDGREDLPGGKDHDHHDNNPPVSDTLSQDSGVQDEDMSEDGLRFSQDESPTSHGGESSSSVFDAVAMVTPDEIPASVMIMNDADHSGGSGSKSGVVDAVGVDVEVVESGNVTKPSPVPSPRASPRVTLSRPSPPSPSPRGGSARQRHESPSRGTSSPDVVAAQPAVVVDDNDDDSLSQGSLSPRCSSGLQGTAVSSPRGGVSTNGERGAADESAHVSEVQEKQDVQSGVKHSQQVNQTERDVTNSAMRKDVTPSHSEKKPSSPRLSEQTQPPPIPTSAPPATSPEDNNEEEEDSIQEDAFATTDSAELVSSRKWCILDQSGSLFLHGDATTSSTPPVSIAMATLRQVSSLMPLELAAMMKEGNRDLDSAKLPKTVELRVVSSRGLNGRPVSIDVTQREDYFVQVTQVHTKNCCVEEADLLLSIDGRTMKNRRPAQVHAAIDATGPKGTMLTARGMKLPMSLSRPAEAKNLDPSTPRTASPTPTTPTSPVPAVEVSPGVFDVTMVKGATGVGFCLEGGKASPMGDLPILIKRIFKGGPAEKCGQLKVKDEILMVNDVDFTVLRHYEAWNHLKFLDDGPVRLRIRRSES